MHAVVGDRDPFHPRAGSIRRPLSQPSSDARAEALEQLADHSDGSPTPPSSFRRARTLASRRDRGRDRTRDRASQREVVGTVPRTTCAASMTVTKSAPRSHSRAISSVRSVDPSSTITDRSGGRPRSDRRRRAVEEAPPRCRPGSQPAAVRRSYPKNVRPSVIFRVRVQKIPAVSCVGHAMQSRRIKRSLSLHGGLRRSWRRAPTDAHETASHPRPSITTSAQAPTWRCGHHAAARGDRGRRLRVPRHRRTRREVTVRRIVAVRPAVTARARGAPVRGVGTARSPSGSWLSTEATDRCDAVHRGRRRGAAP